LPHVSSGAGPRNSPVRPASGWVRHLRLAPARSPTARAGQRFGRPHPRQL